MRENASEINYTDMAISSLHIGENSPSDSGNKIRDYCMKTQLDICRVVNMWPVTKSERPTLSCRKLQLSKP
jgi:hypothetical protein